MARNKSEKLPHCPEAIAYAEAVEAGRLDDLSLNALWGRIPGSICSAIGHERRYRKSWRGASYLGDSLNKSHRDYRINAAIIRERYAP